MDFIYNYTEKLIEDQGESLNRLDTKLSGFLAFTGLMIKFASDFPKEEDLENKIQLICYSCIILKILTIICLMVAAILLGWGIVKKVKPGVISPKDLIKYKDQSPKKVLQYSIVYYWIKAELDYEELGVEKQENLSRAVWLIVAALTMLGVNILIVKIVPFF